MFLRSTKRKKDGKEHRYWSVVESIRQASGPVHQKTLLYLGELNDSEQASWTKALEVFNAESGQAETRSLFPSDRTPPTTDAPALSLRLADYRLSHPRQYGACWLTCDLWGQLGLDQFWEGKLEPSREGTDWARLLQVSVAYRLIAPGSEWRCHRQWYDRSAMGDLLGPDFHWGGKDQLYLVLDRLLEHRGALFTHLQDRWKDLFGAKYEVLLYDLTSIPQVRDQAEQIPKALFGHSRDHRSDCRQVVIALVITPEGFPLAYEVMPGNTSDKTTLKEFLAKIQSQYGQAQRIWIMDRGISTEEVLAQMRATQPSVHYLVGTPRARVRQTLKLWEALPWKSVKDSVEVKLFREAEELYIVAKSGGRQAKEIAMRRKKLARLLWALRGMRHETSRDRLLLRLGAAKSKAGRAASLVEITLPATAKKTKKKDKNQRVEPGSFRFGLKKEALKEAELYDGHYLLRSNLSDKEPECLWKLYRLLVEIEAVFKSFKNDLGLRPIYHSVAPRVEAHIFVCFLAYCLQVTLRQRVRALAPGLTPRAVLETLAGVQMLDLEVPTTDGRWLVMSRYTQPEKAVDWVLARLKMKLPDQPPPPSECRTNDDQLTSEFKQCSEDLCR